LLLVGAAAMPAAAQEPRPEPPPEEPEESPEAPPPVIDVTIRGARLRPPTSPRDPTAASTVVSDEALRAPGASSADVLARVPGVQVSRTGSPSDLATASIRGATSAQTPVYLAGILLNDDVAGTADLSTLPLWMLHRVEVYRGHAPAYADQPGIGGAVFFEPRLPRRTRVGLGQSIGSFGERSTWIAGEVRADASASLVALRRSHATNDYPYTDDRGTRFDDSDDAEVSRENADFTSHDAWAIGRHRLGPGSDVTLIANAFDREQGVTGLGVLPARRSRALVRRFLGGVSARVPCARSAYGAADGPCKLSLSSTLISARSQIHDPLAELTLQSSQVSNDATRFTQRAGVRHRFEAGHDLGVRVSQAAEHLGVESPDRKSVV